MPRIVFAGGFFGAPGPTGSGGLTATGVMGLGAAAGELPENFGGG